MQMPPVDRSPNWRPQGADLYSTGASGAVPVRPVNGVTPVESTDRLGEGSSIREPDKPSDKDVANRDWTELRKKEKEEAEKAKEPPPEPIYKQLLEFIQSMWRARLRRGHGAGDQQAHPCRSACPGKPRTSR